MSHNKQRCNKANNKHVIIHMNNEFIASLMQKRVFVNNEGIYEHNSL